MDVLIKNVQIVDPDGAYDGKRRDILIREGRIASIGQAVRAEGVLRLEGEQWYVSAGWMDMGVQTGDPGYEHRENLESASEAAAAGGFTAIACQPNTAPALHSKSEVLYILHNTRNLPVSFYPIGALSMDCAGKEITEMIDMHMSGALAFSDGKKPLQHGGLMLRALQYVKGFGGLVINQPLDREIGGHGQMHEGEVSTSLGLPGIPAIAEELMVRRDLHLLEYAGSRLHLANLSTAGAVQMVREAKANGLQVTASVAVMNLIFDDSAASTFDSNFKVMPPLRGKEDREALREGVLDGTIDAISSNHVPLEEELKKKEFSYAEFGVTGLEVLYAVCKTHLGDWLSDELFVRKVALNPRKILGLPIPRIEEGQPAELTLFSPVQQWAYTRNEARSRSLNSPFLGKELEGRVVAIINKGQLKVVGQNAGGNPTL
ncbi:MAG: dihydroorotase [Phaeodactylibacter sp.]|nr:dihydroorotase [Phaeodactylibacter sp.]MCB9052091.1 dihydroorotase [Lewinellaceae bacterium]